MNRVAVIIAVKKAGRLPELQAVLEGAGKMRDWALEHGFEPDSVISITDESAPVTVRRIVDAIKEVVKARTCEQLFIYFAGHGVNLRYSEYWLLSEAPDDANEAVNVAASVQLAKRCGIPHVVFISDACRTAPEGIQAQSISGSQIFPNQAAAGPSQAVDVFYASLLGEPALEIRDGNETTSRYQSLYTRALLSALQGEQPSLLDPKEPNVRKYLRPHKLKRYLSDTVPRLVAAKLGLLASHTQVPDADILSDEFAFLQDFDPGALPLPQDVAPPQTRGPSISQPLQTRASITSVVLQQVLQGEVGDVLKNVNASLSRSAAGGRSVSEALQREANSFGPTHFETNCGFKVQGAKFKAIHAGGLNIEWQSPEVACVIVGDRPMANVILEMADGRAVVLPAIRHFIAALTFNGEDLINISYEPSDHSVVWQEYSQVREELAALRAVISSSVHMGVFRLNAQNAPQFIERIRYFKGIDPTLAIYAAYSYHRMGNPDLIRDMEVYLVGGLSASLFDVALLAERDTSASNTYPFFPMLAQGWSLLEVFGALTGELKELQPHVTNNSLWTVFKPSAMPLLLNRKLNQ